MKQLNTQMCKSREIAFVVVGLMLMTLVMMVAYPVSAVSTAQHVSQGGTVLINEVDSDTPGTDALEFVELYDGGVGNTDLTGLVVVFFNGSSDLSYAAFDLDGFTTNANGYFLLGNVNVVPVPDITFADNFLQNGQDAVALYTANATDFPTNTPVTTVNLVDALVYDTADADDPGLLVLLNTGQPQIDEADGAGSAIDSNKRCPNGSGGLRNTVTYIQGAPTPDAINCAADLTVSKTGTPLTQPGGSINYTIGYGNSGQITATNTILTDTLPPYVSYVSDNSGLTCPACVSGATGTLTWTVGTLSPTTNVAFALTAIVSNSVPYGSTLTNTVEITTPDVEITIVNNSDSWETEISPLDVSLSKEGPAYGMIGQTLVYTLSISNQGATTATNLILTDTLPISTTYTADNSSVTPTNPSPGVYVWSFGDVPSNTVQTFNLTITVDSAVLGGTVLNNTADVHTDTPGDPTSNNSDAVNTAVYPYVTIYEIQTVPDPASSDVSPYNGQVVWVDGVVTAQPGEIDTPSRLMVMQDPASGPWSGLVIFRSAGLPAAPAGTLVRVLGTVTEFNELTEMNLSSDPWLVETMGTTAVPAPQVLATNAFDDVDPATSEQWEGVLIEFQDATVTDEDLGFAEWYFDDGSGPARADDLGNRDGNLTYVPALDDAYNFIRGIGWFSFNNYKLIPRDNGDISLDVDTPGIGKTAPVLVAPGSLFTYTVSVTNTFAFPLTGTVVVDVVPQDTTFAYALDGGVVSAGAVIWNVGTIPSLDAISVRFAVTATNEITAVVNDQYAVGASNFPTPTIGAPVVTFVDTNLHIHHIQGARHYSLLTDADVQDIEGVVTAVTNNGFYMQEPDPDGDIATSEGIFVFTSNAPTVQVGDLVQVDGTVNEFYSGGVTSGGLSTTELDSSNITTLSSGNPLPPPVILGQDGRIPPNQVIDDDANGDVNVSGTFDATTDGIDFYESLEGMLVQVNDAVVVGSNAFGEIQLLGDGGDNGGVLSPRGAIVIQETDFNPERIILDDVLVSNPPVVSTGDSFTDIITGVVGYSFGNFKVLNVEPLPPVAVSGLVSETTTLAGTADSVTVGALNVENLDPGDGTAQFAALAEQIVTHMGAPDILSVEEVQDNNGATNNGVVAADQTYQALIDAIATAGGPTYEYRQIDPVDGQDGGEPGGNIRVGFLFNPARVTFVDRAGGGSTITTTVSVGPTGVELSASPGRIDPNDPAFSASRKPLVGEFVFNGYKIFVIANHFNSKGGDNPLFGRFQPPVLASEVQRSQQAQIVNDFVDNILALDPGANVVVLGDLNDFQFSTPIEILMGDVLTALVNTLPVEERYTYVFDGNAQVLDHILASDNLMENTAVLYDVVHMNAEFDVDARATDHDGVVALFTLSPLSAGFNSNSPVLLGQTSVFTNTTTGLEPISYEWDFGDGSPVVTDTNPTYMYTAVATYTVTLTATNASGAVGITGTFVVSPMPPLVAGFTSNSPVTLGATSLFTNTSSGPDPISYEWDFGDSSAVVTNTNPTHVYTAVATYTVTLTATNLSGSVVVTGTHVVVAVSPTSYQVYLPVVMKPGTAVSQSNGTNTSVGVFALLPLAVGLIWLPTRKHRL